MKDTISVVARQSRLVMLGLGLIFSSHAIAWDGVVSGRITQFEITNGANFAFRVFINGGILMCTGGPSWAFLNESDSNYKTYVANLMLAKVQGLQVNIFSTAESGFCRIGHVVVQSQ